MQSQWLRFASSIERDRHEPNFTDLKKFIANEADVTKSLYAKAYEDICHSYIRYAHSLQNLYMLLCQKSKWCSIPRVVFHSTLVSAERKDAKMIIP